MVRVDCHNPHAVVAELATRLLSMPLLVRQLDSGTCDMQLYESAEQTTVLAGVEGGNAAHVKQQVAAYWASWRTSTLW